MNAHARPPAAVVRFPPRLRVVSITVDHTHYEDAEPATARVETLLPQNPATTALSAKTTVTSSPQRMPVARSPKGVISTSALNALLSAGTIDARQHATGLAYGALRQRHNAGMVSARFRGPPVSDAVWQAGKREHAALIRAAGAERFMLDRLCLDGDAPLRCEVERVRDALERVTGQSKEGLSHAEASACLDRSAVHL